MPRRPALTEDHAFRLGCALTGLTMTASAGLAADLARGHMTALATLCGAATHPHCGWCYAALGLALAGLTALVAAARPVSRPARSAGPGNARLARPSQSQVVLQFPEV